jgi:hypothetical protein
MSEREVRPRTRPATIGAAWSELRSNTLRKTGPQLLLGLFYWGLVVSRHHLYASTPYLFLFVPAAAGFVFYGVVLIRVIPLLPRGFPVSLIRFWLLFLGYTLWLGFVPPVDRRDLREWLGWAAMASGFIVFLVLVRPPVGQ